MHDLDLLRDLVILVAVAIPVVAVAQRFRIPTVVGFLVTGIAVGPHAAGLIADAEAVSGLAEIGVVLLLFTIGLELSLARIIKMGAVVLRAGALQVFGTLGAVAGVFLLLGRPGNVALFLGGLAALSSTAIVLKVYADRGELDAPHGRVAVAILIFQDLAVVPMILLVPILAGGGGSGTVAQGLISLAIGLLVVVGIVVLGRRVVPMVLERIAALRNRELFTLCVGFFGVAAAYASASIGLSLEFGAFVAGLVISESEFGVQALSDVLPFGAVFNGIFFISVGMLLDVGFVWANPGALLLAAIGILIIKTIITGGVILTLPRPAEVAIQGGLGLAQVGEFSFVLATVAAPYGLLDADTYQLFLGASILSMLAAPFVIMHAGRLARQVRRVEVPRGQPESPEGHEIAGLEDHAIIVGYGIAGRHLCRVLGASGFPYLVLEQNGQVVRAGRAAGQLMLFGDGTRREVLERAGISRARVIVFSISSPAGERHGVAEARALNASIPIIVRTRYVAAIDDLRQLGATEVVVEEFEAALELFALVLTQYFIPQETISEELAAVRTEQYGMLRGQGTALPPLNPFPYAAVNGAIEMVELRPECAAVGESPVTLDLRRRTGAVVIAVVREGAAHYTLNERVAFEPLDVVVLAGDSEALQRARAALTEGSGS